MRNCVLERAAAPGLGCRNETNRRRAVPGGTNQGGAEEKKERTNYDTVGFYLSGLWRCRCSRPPGSRAVYNRHSRGRVLSGLSGGQAAALILRQAGIHDVEITHHDEMLGDHYDPLRKRLVLSSQNYFGSSPAALGVAAHECGHAIQHQQAYRPLHWRMAAVGITTYASQIVMWLPLLGVFTGLIQPMVAATLLAAAWGVIMLFNLVTLPVEFDASRRAKVVLGPDEHDRPRP